jgi:hypothetical protein
MHLRESSKAPFEKNIFGSNLKHQNEVRKMVIPSNAHRIVRTLFNGSLILREEETAVLLPVPTRSSKITLPVHPGNVFDISYEIDNNY